MEHFCGIVRLTSDRRENADVGDNQQQEWNDEHGQQAEYSVELFLPFFSVEAISNTLIEWFAEGALQHPKDHELKQKIQDSFCSCLISVQFG